MRLVWLYYFEMLGTAIFAITAATVHDRSPERGRPPEKSINGARPAW